MKIKLLKTLMIIFAFALIIPCAVAFSACGKSSKPIDSIQVLDASGKIMDGATDVELEYGESFDFSKLKVKAVFSDGETKLLKASDYEIEVTPKMKEIPDAGDYTVYVKYKSLSFSFVIRVDYADPSTTPTVEINGYEYATTISTAPTLSENPSGGEVTFYYSSEDNNENGTPFSVSESKYIGAGTYYIYAVIEANGNYESIVTNTTSFVVEKATLNKVGDPVLIETTYEPSMTLQSLAFSDMGTYTYGEDNNNWSGGALEWDAPDLGVSCQNNGDMFSVTYKTNDPNIEDYSFEFAIDIKKAQVSTPWTDVVSYNYDATTKTIQIQTGLGLVNASSNNYYTVSGQTGTNAGDYSLVLELRDKVNYEWRQEESYKNQLTAQGKSIPTSLTENLTYSWEIKKIESGIERLLLDGNSGYDSTGSFVGIPYKSGKYILSFSTSGTTRLVSTGLITYEIYDVEDGSPETKNTILPEDYNLNGNELTLTKTGFFRLKMTIAGDDNFENTTAYATITINKIDPTYEILSPAGGFSLKVGEDCADPDSTGYIDLSVYNVTGDADVSKNGTWSWSNDGITWASEVGNGTMIVNAIFTPENTDIYVTKTDIAITITINKGTPNGPAPVSTEANPLKIRVGENYNDIDLSSFNYDETSVYTQGTWSWTANDSYLVSEYGTGTMTAYATFTPENTTNYEVLTDVEVVITILKGTPIVKTIETLYINYNENYTTLDLSQYNVNSGTDYTHGTWAWNSVDGSQVYMDTTKDATFTPTDSVNYDTYRVSVSIKLKTQPTYTVPAVAFEIEIGTNYNTIDLSSYNVTGDVDVSKNGTWSWTNPEGAVLMENSTVYATFTPESEAYETITNIEIEISVIGIE